MISLMNLTVDMTIEGLSYIEVMSSGGFRVGGARGKTKKGPLMTSSCSANRDMHF